MQCDCCNASIDPFVDDWFDDIDGNMYCSEPCLQQQEILNYDISIGNI